MKRLSPSVAQAVARGLPPEDREAFLAGQRAPAVNPRRSLGAKIANAADDAFMVWCSQQHTLAKSAAVGILGRLRHCGPPVRFVGPGVCEPTGTGPADFQGQLSRRYGSLSVAIEAKSSEGRLALSKIPEHQQEDLDDCARHGGVAVLLYEHREEHGARVTQFAMRWQEVPWRSVRAGAGVSIGPEECAPWRVRGLYWQELMEGRR